MKTLASMAILGLCLAVCPGCRHHSGVLVSRDSPNYSNVVAVADHLVSKAQPHWGTHLEVRWQPAPLNRYAVVYAMDDHDYCEVHVYTNSDGGLTARGD